MRIEYKIDPFGPDIHTKKLTHNLYILSLVDCIKEYSNVDQLFQSKIIFFLNDKLIANMKRKEKG